jgi:hypothetical protein
MKGITMQTLTFAAHVAYLDPMTGEGLLVRPKPADDLSLSMPSLHAADWDAAIAHLRGLGWEPTADDDGSPMLAGITADGRDVIGLYGREPITTMPTLAGAAGAAEELARLAGLTL